MKTKKIKGSKRGLTFSLDENDVEIGARYRYVVDTKKNEILIIMDEDGPLKVSRKKTGSKIKPLFDLRSREVKEAIASADYMEVEFRNDQIVVSTFKKYTTRFRLLRNKTCSISEILGTKKSEIILPMAMAAGDECYQMTIDDYVAGILAQTEASADVVAKVAKDLPKVYDVVSLFSGAGLFDKSFLDTGRFRFVYANDLCEDVLETYKYNIGAHIVCKDIRDVTQEELPFSDVFLTSPCCQAFSNANRRDIETEGAELKRLLVDEVIRLANFCNPNDGPSVIVIENVPQMLTKEHGLYIDRIITGLQDNYNVTAQIVRDEECGGYSTRKRAIVIATRKDIGKIELPNIKCVTYRTVREALSKVDATWYNYEDVTVPAEATSRKMSFVPQGGNWKDVPPEIGKYGPNTQSNILRRLSWDKPSITLSNFRKSNILHPEENRILTVAEAGAIMGLEKDFRFISKSLSAKQQMVANGVTQAIGRFVGNAIIKKLDAFHSGAYQLCT